MVSIYFIAQELDNLLALHQLQFCMQQQQGTIIDI